MGPYHEGAPKISRVHLGVHLGVHKGPGVIILKCFGQHGHIGSNQMNQNIFFKRQVEISCINE